MIKRRFLLLSVFIASIIISLLLYKDSFSSYFFQDDWFSFRISNAQTVADFLSFFAPRNDVIYYRPLGMQVPFFIMQRIFGLSQFPYRLLSFITIITASVVVYKISDDALRHKSASLLAAFLYATSAVHYIPMYWFATYAFILGPLFVFLSLWLIRKHYIYSIIFHIAALMTFEIAVVTPVLLILTFFFNNKKVLLKPIIPYVILSASYIVFRLLVNTAPTSGDYLLALDSNILNNFRGYLMWSLNWPEELKAQMVSFFRFNPLYISEFYAYFYPYVFGLIAVLLVFMSWAILSGAKKIRIYAFAAGVWFTASLLPVLFFPKHSFPYYLPVPLLGFLLVLATIVKKAMTTKGPKSTLAKITLLLFVVMWIWTSERTSSLNQKIHWAPRRAILAKVAVERAQTQGHAARNLIYVGDNEELKWALNNQDAMRVVFMDTEQFTVYGQ